MKIFFAAEDPLLRAGLRLMFSQVRGVEILGEAPDGPTALRDLETLAPEIALMDETAFGGKLFVNIRMLRERVPKLKIVLLSNFDYHDLTDPAFAAGVDGCVIKSVANDELIRIIKSINKGIPVQSPFWIQPPAFLEAALEN